MAYTLKNEAESFPETLMTIYQQTWHHIPLDPHERMCENMISHRFGFYSIVLIIFLQLLWHLFIFLFLQQGTY